jgi:hypothetical protein
MKKIFTSFKRFLCFEQQKVCGRAIEKGSKRKFPIKKASTSHSFFAIIEEIIFNEGNGF